MHELKIIAIAIGAIIFIVGSTAVTIAALWGKDKNRHRRRNNVWDESIEDM